MKLAEALILRADAQRRIEQLRDRLQTSAKVQEGEQPPEKPQDLIEELDRVSATLLDLIKRINKTNSTVTFSEDVTLSDALAQRDVLMLMRRVYTSLAEAASVGQNRYSRSEIKYYSTVNVAEIQKRVDDLSKQHRELDARIQEANWNTELVEG